MGRTDRHTGPADTLPTADSLVATGAVRRSEPATADRAPRTSEQPRTEISAPTDTALPVGTERKTEPATENHAARADGATRTKEQTRPKEQTWKPAPAAEIVTRAAEPADTLVAKATVAEWPFPVYGTADTLRLQLAERAADAAANPAVAASAEAVFGPGSVLAEKQALSPGQPQSLTDNAVFQGFVLMLAAAYALLLYYNLGDIRALLSRISRDTASGKRLFEDPAGSGFMRFLNTTSAIGMLFIGVLAVKYGDTLMPAPLLDMLPQGAVLALSLLSTAACMSVILYQRAAVRIAGAVTLAQPFVTQLQLLRRTYFALAVVVISPALLLFALCPRGTGEAWFLLIVIELAITVFLYLREALNLFLSKKISILHWFLYLCAVEVFPISFLWLVAAR